MPMWTQAITTILRKSFIALCTLRAPSRSRPKSSILKHRKGRSYVIMRSVIAFSANYG